jgi:hypothetical protein
MYKPWLVVDNVILVFGCYKKEENKAKLIFLSEGSVTFSIHKVLTSIPFLEYSVY